MQEINFCAVVNKKCRGRFLLQENLFNPQKFLISWHKIFLLLEIRPGGREALLGRMLIVRHKKASTISHAGVKKPAGAGWGNEKPSARGGLEVSLKLVTAIAWVDTYFRFSMPPLSRRAASSLLSACIWGILSLSILV